MNIHKMNLVNLIFLIAILVMPSWSFWGKDKPDSNWPLSREAKILEQTNSSEVLMEATGYGKKTKYLDQDIKRAAVWYLLFSGTDPLLQTEEERKAFDRIAEKFFTKVNQFIPWISPKVKSQRKVETTSDFKKMRRVRELKVNKDMIRRLLIQQGIIQERSEVLDDAGMPFIMVLPDAPQGQSPMKVFSTNNLANHTAGVIESFLTQRKYDIVIPKAQADIGKLVEFSQSGQAIDPSYQMAMTVGADIYIVFSGSVDRQGMTHKAAVSVKAYETTTGKGLGTETGYSKDRPVKIHEKALIEEATNDAIEKVLSRVDAYWKKDIEKGTQYRLNIKMNETWDRKLRMDIQDQIAEIIEGEFKNFKELALTDQTMEYIVWAHQGQAKKASSLYRKLRRQIESNVAGVSLERQVVNKKLLLLELNPQ